MPDSPEVRPTLNEVIVAFQKELSRARRHAHEKSFDLAVREGLQPLFVVEALEVDMKVGVTVDGTAETPDVVRVDFSAPPDQRSIVKFRVAIKPVDSNPEG